MEIQYLGANSIKITTKKAVLSIDPVSDIAQLKPDLKKTTVTLVTKPELQPQFEAGMFLIDGPGEYEFEDCSIKGIAAQPHTASTGDMSATMYRISSGDTTVLIVGHVNPKLSEDQLEMIGSVDAAIVPVGGGGYTLDALEATGLVRLVEPKLVVPVHAAEDNLTYDIEQQPITTFVTELGAPVADDTLDKLKIKTLPEQLTVQLLQQQ